MVRHLRRARAIVVRRLAPLRPLSPPPLVSRRRVHRVRPRLGPRGGGHGRPAPGEHDDEAGKTPRRHFTDRMKSAIDEGDHASALAAFDDIGTAVPRQSGRPRVRALIKLAARAGDPDAAVEALEAMLTVGHVPRVHTHGKIILACNRAGDLRRGADWLDMLLETESPDSATQIREALRQGAPRRGDARRRGRLPRSLGEDARGGGDPTEGTLEAFLLMESKIGTSPPVEAVCRTMLSPVARTQIPETPPSTRRGARARPPRTSSVRETPRAAEEEETSEEETSEEETPTGPSSARRCAPRCARTRDARARRRRRATVRRRRARRTLRARRRGDVVHHQSVAAEGRSRRDDRGVRRLFRRRRLESRSRAHGTRRRRRRRAGSARLQRAAPIRGGRSIPGRVVRARRGRRTRGPNGFGVRRERRGRV